MSNESLVNSVSASTTEQVLNEIDIGGTKCSTDLNDDTGETKFCRQMKIINLIDSLNNNYLTKEKMESNLDKIGNTIKSVIESNGITTTDLGEKAMSELFDNLKIHPNDTQLRTAIKFISFENFKKLTGITNITRYQIVLLQVHGLVNKVIKYRNENRAQGAVQIPWRGGRSGKKKTMKKISKRSKKTMKRNNRKRGSYKKYTGGDPISFVLNCIVSVVFVLFTGNNSLTDEEKELIDKQIEELKKRIAEIELKISKDPKNNGSLHITLIGYKNKLSELETTKTNGYWK
jgi:hypothetical protein